jgi:hypothetical protein
MVGLFDWEVVTVPAFCDAWVCSFAAAFGDAFEYLSDSVTVCLGDRFGGKIPPGL